MTGIILIVLLHLTSFTERAERKVDRQQNQEMAQKAARAKTIKKRLSQLQNPGQPINFQACLMDRPRFMLQMTTFGLI